MVNYFFISEIKFYKIIIAFPAFIPQAVIVVGISVKINIKPVFITGFMSVFKDILKSRKSTSYMVKYSVKYYTDSVVGKFFSQIFKVFVGSEPYVYFFVIPCIIAVCIGFKYG